MLLTVVYKEHSSCVRFPHLPSGRKWSKLTVILAWLVPSCCVCVVIYIVVAAILGDTTLPSGRKVFVLKAENVCCGSCDIMGVVEDHVTMWVWWRIM
jgi:hypothetical protein